MDLIKRMKFWIGVGLLVLLSGVVFGALFLPARAKNSREAAAWEQRVAGVEAIVGQRGLEQLPSEGDIQVAGQMKEQLEQQLVRARQLLEEQDRLIEDYIPDAATGERVGREGGVWKLVYEEQMRNLDADIRKSFAVAPPALVSPQAYGDVWPGDEEMKKEAKNYWVQRHLLESLAAANSRRMVVPVLTSFRLLKDAKPERFLHPTHGTMFQVHPFELQIATEFPNIPFVLQQLLKCKVAVAITSLEAERRGAAAAPAGEGRAPAAPRSPMGGAPGAARSAGPSSMRMGPPAGMMMGPPAGTVMGPMGPPPGLRMGPSFGSMGPSSGFRGPTGGTRRAAAPAAPRPAAATGAPSAPATAAEGLSQALVNVTIRGYVLDYRAPTAEKAK